MGQGDSTLSGILAQLRMGAGAAPPMQGPSPARSMPASQPRPNPNQDLINKYGYLGAPVMGVAGALQGAGRSIGTGLSNVADQVHQGGLNLFGDAGMGAIGWGREFDQAQPNMGSPNYQAPDQGPAGDYRSMLQAGAIPDVNMGRLGSTMMEEARQQQGNLRGGGAGSFPGQMFDFGAPKSFDPLASPKINDPDYSEAEKALGPAPIRDDEISKTDKIIQLLGGAAGGALKGGGGQPGGTVASILAGAAAGTATEHGNLMKLEDSRAEAFKSRQDQYNQNMSTVRLRGAQAQTETDHLRARMDAEMLMTNRKVELETEKLYAPQMSYSGGVVSYMARDPKTGNMVGGGYDLFKDVRMLEAMGKAGGKEVTAKVFSPFTNTWIERDSVPPETSAVWELAAKFVAQRVWDDDPKARAFINDRLNANTKGAVQDIDEFESRAVTNMVPPEDNTGSLMRNAMVEYAKAYLAEMSQGQGQGQGQGGAAGVIGSSTMQGY